MAQRSITKKALLLEEYRCLNRFELARLNAWEYGRVAGFHMDGENRGGGCTPVVANPDHEECRLYLPYDSEQERLDYIHRSNEQTYQWRRARAEQAAREARVKQAVAEELSKCRAHAQRAARAASNKKRAA